MLLNASLACVAQSRAPRTGCASLAKRHSWSALGSCPHQAASAVMPDSPPPVDKTLLRPKTPLLLFLSSINLLLYIDRGVIGSNGVNGSQATRDQPGSGIQGHFKISTGVDGLLPGAFMVGLLLSSPVFAEGSKHLNAFRLLAIGLTIWVLACAGSGLATSFPLLVFCRMIVGIGEASFVALAAPLIDDTAPNASKTKWLALFYLCIPTGYALGYILGGILAGPLTWRGPFFVEAFTMVPFALVCSCAQPIQLRGLDHGKLDAHNHNDVPSGKHWLEVLTSFRRDIFTLFRHPVYVLNLLASALYTGVIGAYAFLGPMAARQIFALPGETADLTFGIITVLTGIIGTLIGGIVLDKAGSGVSNALTISVVCTLSGCAACVLCFAVARRLLTFVSIFAVGELFLFGLQAPQNAVNLWSIPPRLRPFAVSISIVVTHILGDVPSPAAVGWLQDHLKSWRLSMSLCTLFLLPSCLLYGTARVLSPSKPDYQQIAIAELDSEQAVQAPLLSDDAIE